MRLVFVTCDPLPEEDIDLAPLTAAATARGLDFRWLPWDAPLAAFADSDRVVLRSTWDYIHHVDDFLRFCDAIGPRLVNPPGVVRWNAHKGYLLDLDREGLAVVPTELVRRGTPGTLAALAARRNFGMLVVKPAVGAGSFATRKIDGRAPTAEDERFFAELVATRDVLVQPYVRSVETSGERSLVTLGGTVTHAIRKTARFDGDHEAVSDAAMPVADDERAFAERAIAIACRLTGTDRLAYARVDLARDEAGRPMLMELELIEPSLFFSRAPAAIERFLDVVTAP